MPGARGLEHRWRQGGAIVVEAGEADLVGFQAQRQRQPAINKIEHLDGGGRNFRPDPVARQDEDTHALYRPRLRS